MTSTHCSSSEDNLLALFNECFELRDGARIAASKTNYRKADALLEQRKGGVDYSCVARTGSPCPAADPAAASGGSGAPDSSGKVEDL